LALFPFTFSDDKRAFPSDFLSHRAHVFSLPSAKGDMNCMFTGEKVTASTFSVNIGFISVKDVAGLATLFGDVRPEERRMTAGAGRKLMHN
jgi:hypothetical protein